MFFPDDAVRVAALSSSVEGAPGYAGSNPYRAGFNSSILQQEVHR